jgi:hypothetical protein
MRISAGRSILAVFALALPLGLAVAESPEKPPSKEPNKGKAHPNLTSASKLAAQAYDKLEAAQKANEYDLGGHAAKAKALLKQASEEIKLAREALGGNDKTRKKDDDRF